MLGSRSEFMEKVRAAQEAKVALRRELAEVVEENNQLRAEVKKLKKQWKEVKASPPAKIVKKKTTPKKKKPAK